MLSLNHTGWIIFRGQALFVEYRELSVKAIQRVKGIEAEVATLQGDAEVDTNSAAVQSFAAKMMRVCAGCVTGIKIGKLKPEKDGVEMADRLPTKKSLKPLELEYENAEGKVVEGVFASLDAEERVEALLSYGSLLNQIVSLVRHDDEAVILGK